VLHYPDHAQVRPRSRLPWRVLSSVVVDDAPRCPVCGCSMEECEALCGRIGIMVDGELQVSVRVVAPLCSVVAAPSSVSLARSRCSHPSAASRVLATGTDVVVLPLLRVVQCLGSVQYLKHRFGAGYSAEFKMGAVSPADVARTLDVAVAANGGKATFRTLEQLKSVCSALGTAQRAAQLTAVGTGASTRAVACCLLPRTSVLCTCPCSPARPLSTPLDHASSRSVCNVGRYCSTFL
jgi:hypothetical protein